MRISGTGITSLNSYAPSQR